MLDLDKVVWSALSNMYGKCGRIEEVRRIFCKMVNRDVAWITMIDRYFEGRGIFFVLGVDEIRH